MAIVVPSPPALSGDLALFYTTDPLLANAPVLVFHGPAATVGGTSSRIQVHVFTPAGVGSYARLAVSPNSPLYSAVSNLPREEQGDEVCRGLAFGLKRYFAELPETVKKIWCTQAKAPSPAMLFGDDHVAVLATRMSRIENVEEVIATVAEAFSEQRQSWLDVDIVLPPGSIKEPPKRADSANYEDLTDAEALQQRYGRYAELLSSLGSAAFLPTTRLKRAPSKANAFGRSASFLRHQKESVRKEVCELVDTEESYVERIRDLQRLSTSIGGDLNPTSRKEVRAAFPDAIDAVVDLNTRFLDALRTLADATETAALQDIESTSESQQSSADLKHDIAADAQGIGSIAKCLCEWLPRFAEAYGQYMKSQAECTQALRNMLRSTDATLVATLQEAGEQKLTSLLIEPVQRLPRYTLYIDSIVKQLPARHPAIKHLLRARDIVTDICAHDDAKATSSAVMAKLRSRVSDWPADCAVSGRFVSAADVTFLTPPYLAQGCDGDAGILLTFTDGLILLQKAGQATVTARGLQSELENAPMAPQPSVARLAAAQELHFVRRVQLDACECIESHSGAVLQMYTRFEFNAAAHPPQQTTVDSCEVLRLEGSYEGKAARLVEEVIKAKIEHRYSEAERESTKWEFRVSDSVTDHATLLGAVFDNTNADHVAARQGTSSVRILVDIDRHAQRPRAGQDGIRTVVSLAPLKDGLWRLTVDTVDGPASREHVSTLDIATVLGKRLAALTASRFAIEDPSTTTHLLARHAAILASIELQAVPDDEVDSSKPEAAERLRRPKSPRKLLSSFLSSTGPGSQPPALLKKDLPPLPPPGQLPRARLAEQMPSNPSSRESRPSSRDQPAPRSLTSARSTDQLRQISSPYKKLEDTLSAYILALQARKGNIVGRSLKMRATADELAVSELYNSLLEDPNMMVLAAEATVDVLFAAFEEFLNIAWKEQVGPVVPYNVIQDIQHKAETLFPTDFDAHFKATFSSLSPQNQRAFKGIMKLLADLLDGTGNDGDRGILTAAFAELLVTEGNARDFIALIDRFVDDTDTYFGEPLEDAQRPTDGPGSIHKRARSVNSASISSNTSSLRKKFGLSTLSRANSKSEEESKMAAVWRTLSKSTRGEASPASSISRGTLQRAYSTDIDGRNMPTRPVSQEGPSLKPSPIDDAAALTGPSSTQNLGLSTIGEHPSFIPTGPPRKKRRSSLSDLKALDGSPRAQSWMSPSPRRPPPTHRQLEDKSLPHSPVPSTPSSKGGSGRSFGSPTREPPRSRLPSSFRKENSPGADKVFAAMAPAPLRPRNSSKQLDEVNITGRPISSIPTLAPRLSTTHKAASPSPRIGLSERAGAGNIVKRPSPQPEKISKPSISTPIPADTSTPKKLRMQSPQKLRERLQNEQAALMTAQTSLQDELSKIGDELTASITTPSRIGTIRGSASKPSTLRHANTITGSSTPAPHHQNHQPTTLDLAQRILKLEAHLVSQLSTLHSSLQTIQTDLASSLVVSENKCKKLDALYREANGENEALYARFNDELGRVLGAVKGGEGVEELRRKLGEAQEEVRGGKREAGRLRREVVGLRAQLRE